MPQGVPQPPSAAGARGLSFFGRGFYGRGKSLGRALLLSLLVHGWLFGPSPWPAISGSRQTGNRDIRAVLRPAMAADATLAAGSAPLAQTADREAPAKVKPNGRRRSATQTQPAPSAPAAEPVQNELSGELAVTSLSQYRLAIARAARGFSADLQAARALGLTGVAEVAVLVSPADATPRVVLEQSSGHPRLDQAAVALIGQAARIAPLPPDLSGHSLRASIPVHFNAGD
jgi:TonB family protein